MVGYGCEYETAFFLLLCSKFSLEFLIFPQRLSTFRLIFSFLFCGQILLNVKRLRPSRKPNSRPFPFHWRRVISIAYTNMRLLPATPFLPPIVALITLSPGSGKFGRKRFYWWTARQTDGRTVMSGKRVERPTDGRMDTKKKNERKRTKTTLSITRRKPQMPTASNPPSRVYLP